MRNLKLIELALLPLCAALSLLPISARAKDNLAVPAGCAIAQASAVAGEVGSGDKVAVPPIFPPLALQIRAPVAPTAFSSNGKNFLVYELHLQNFSSDSLTLRRIDILNPDQTAGGIIAQYHDKALASILRPAGIDNDDEQRSVLKTRQGITAFLCLAFNKKDPIPATLRHRVTLNNGFVLSAVTTVRKENAAILGRPLLGSDWLALHGPHIDSHHRRGLWSNDGIAENARRFALEGGSGLDDSKQ